MPPYYGMVKCIDDNVGKILEVLREQKLIDNTIVVFTSDHGDLCGEHGRLNKGVPYEGSARVPFVIYSPGQITPGTVVKEALSCVDFLPTVMHLMGAPVEHKVDGRDASGLLKGEADGWNDITFLRSTSGKSPWLCAVTKRFKLIISAAEEPWLIDREADPFELTNLINRAEHRVLARRLTAQLQEYCRDNNDTYARNPRIQEEIAKLLN